MNDSNPSRMKNETTNAKGKSKAKIKKKTKTKTKTKRPPPPPWMDLPEDIWANILQRLDTKDILETAQMVCTTWRRVCKDPSMWRVIHIKYHGDPDDPDDDPEYMLHNVELMCRHAIDRSQGRLLDIHLDFFVTSELLAYIAERSANLRRLSIACCYNTVCQGLAKMFQKLPLLEELSLTHTSIGDDGFKALGRYCPLLKSFELNFSFFMNSVDSDDEEDEYFNNYEALAIAKNLPSLCHLQLFGNSMTNEGLQAILKSCPHLVSLDLRRCSNIVNLEKVLSRKYVLQIKDLKYPHDSLAGYTYDPWGEDSDEVDTMPDYYDPYWGSDEEENMYYYSL